MSHSRQYNADMPFGVQSLLVYILRIGDDIIRPIHTFSRASKQISVNETGSVLLVHKSLISFFLVHFLKVVIVVLSVTCEFVDVIHVQTN